MDSLPGTTTLNLDEEAGELSFSWKIDPSSACPPSDEWLTLPDQNALFSLCFEGVMGSTTLEVQAGYVTRVNACPINISMFTGDAVVDITTLVEGPMRYTYATLQVYPTLANQKVFFHLPESLESCRIVIVHAQGQQIGEMEIADGVALELPYPGAYFIAFFTADGRLIKTIPIWCLPE